MTDEDESAADDERDPFGRLEDSAGDREGNPFESLSGPDDDDTPPPGNSAPFSRGTGSDASAGDPADPSSEDSAAPGPSAPAGDGDPENQPGSAASPGTPRVEAGDAETDPGDPFSSPDSAFQRVDVGEIDEGDVWAALSDAQARGSVADVGGRTDAEVAKHSFCETCEHFTGPPEVACTHEGTEILEFLDMETVRVVDCPVVEERRDLERGDGTGP